MIRTRTCAYPGVRKVLFPNNLASFVFSLPPFWDSFFCFITDESVEKYEESVIWMISYRNLAFRRLPIRDKLEKWLWCPELIIAVSLLESINIFAFHLLDKSPFEVLYQISFGFKVSTQLVMACLKLTIETLEQCVKYF